MIRWIPVNDANEPPPVGEVLPIARGDYATAGRGYYQLFPRQRRAPRQVWFNPQHQRIRDPDYYGVEA